MAVNPEGLFAQFLRFCKPYLEKQKSSDLVRLLQKRFNDCNEEFQSSAELSDLIDITTAKIDSDGNHIFVHLRDFLNELKSHQTGHGDRKRKREEILIDDRDTPSPKSFKGESTDPDSDDSLSKLFRKSGATENLFTKCIKSNLSKAANSKQEEEPCITIDDSDDEELITKPVVKEASTTQCKQINGTAFDHRTSTNLSQPFVKLNGGEALSNRSQTHSHTLKKDKLTKCPSQSQSFKNKGSHVSARSSGEKGSECKEGCDEKQLKVMQKSLLKPPIEMDTIVLEDENDEDADAIGKKGENVDSSKCGNIQIKKRIDKIATGNENFKNGEGDQERIVDIEDKPEVRNQSRADGSDGKLDCIESSPDSKSAGDEDDSMESDLDRKSFSGKLDCIISESSDGKIDSIQLGSDGKSSDGKPDSIQLGSDGKSIDGKPDQVMQIESENDDISTEISATELSMDETDYSTENSKESGVKDKEKSCNQSENQSDVAMGTEDSLTQSENEAVKDKTKNQEIETDSHKSLCKKKLVVVLTDIEHSSPSKMETFQTGSEEGEETSQEEDNSKKEEIPNGDIHDITNGYEDDNKPGTSAECLNSSSKENDGDEKPKENGNEVKEKPKTGSKKQIARLEKLLEDLRNKIEELKDKELDLDDMDDDCSPYILEEKYQQKFVKVWNKLCELKNASSATGRPSEKMFRYSGTRYPEINRKIQKFVNKRKQFPDYHDVEEIITKVNHDKKIGLSTTSIERLAREAFLDVGESLQKRRRQDLIYTSAGHIKVGERTSEDPALHDPELKKKLSDNRKLYKDKMEKVLSKFSEKQLNVEDEGGNESEVDQSDEEDANEMEKDKVDVPELATILEDRGSPVLEILDEKSKKMDQATQSQIIDEMDTMDVEVVRETDTFIIENDNAERMEDTEVSVATDCSIISEEKTSGDENALGSPAVLLEMDEEDFSRPTANNSVVSGNEQRDYGNVIEIVNLEEESDKNSAEFSIRSDDNEVECPVLYVAEKIDEPPIQKENVESTHRRPVRILTGDDDLFEMSGVEEMSDSDNDDSRDVASTVDKRDSINRLPNIADKDSHGNISPIEKSTMETKENDRIDSIYSNILSQGSINKVKNMLHLPKTSKISKETTEEENNVSKTDEEVKKKRRLSEQSEILHENGKKHMKDKSSPKAVILTPGLKNRARSILSLNESKTQSKHIDSSKSNTNSSGAKINSLCYSTTEKSGDSSTCTSYSTEPCSILSPEKTCTSKADDCIQTENLKKSRSEESWKSSDEDSDSVMELFLDGSSQESVGENAINERRKRLHSKDSENEGKSHSQNKNHSRNSSQSSRSSPFLKIIDVTSIGIDDYNSDSLDTPLKNTSNSSGSKSLNGSSGTVEYVTSSSNKTSTAKSNSGTSSTFSSLFSKSNKISSFLSQGVKRKKDESKIAHDKSGSKQQLNNSECICVEDLSDTMAIRIDKDKACNHMTTKKSDSGFQLSKVKSRLSLPKKKVVSSIQDSDDGDDDEIQILHEEDIATSDTADDSDVIVLSDSD